MAASTTEIRQLIRADRTQPDSAAVAHVLTGTLFLGVGAVAAALAFISMSFPGFIPLGYGIWRAIAMLGLLVGFGTLTLVGGAYYVLPRLTGARLWNEPLAWLGLVITAATTAAGMIVVAVGWGDGREPFGLPWWLDIPLFVGIGIPPLVAVLTLRNRTESQTFVTIPFVVTGLGGLPWSTCSATSPPRHRSFHDRRSLLRIRLPGPVGVDHHRPGSLDVKQTEKLYRAAASTSPASLRRRVVR